MLRFARQSETQQPQIESHVQLSRGERVIGRAIGWAIGLCLVATAAISAQQTGEDPPSSTGSSTPWMVVGTFKGAADPGLLGKLSNYIFEYETDDSLFRDFGDLGIGIGGDIGTVDVKLDFNFRHRLVSSHENIPPGGTITADNLSILRKVPTARVRLRTYWEYVPSIFTDDDGVFIDEKRSVT